MKHLDHAYSDLDPCQGLYWACEEDQTVRHIVHQAEIERFIHSPPDETRAWTRAMLLRRAHQSNVQHIDWDMIRFGAWQTGRFVERTVHLPHPMSMSRADNEALFERCESLSQLLRQISVPDEPASWHATSLHQEVRAFDSPSTDRSQESSSREPSSENLPPFHGENDDVCT
jgi:hypothetical protein